jgi:hypothetical protein
MSVPMVGIEVRVVGYALEGEGAASQWWVETFLDRDESCVDRFGPFPRETVAQAIAAGLVKMLHALPRAGGRMRR